MLKIDAISHLAWLCCEMRGWNDFLTFRLSWTWFPTTWPSSIPGSSCCKKEIIQIFIPHQDFYSIPGLLFHSRIFIPFQDFFPRVLRLERNHSDFYCDMVSNLLQPCIDTFVRNINSTNLNSNLSLHSTMQLACSKMRLQLKRFFFSKCWTISSFILGFPLSWGW